MVMKTPADPACAPPGDTNTIIGTGDSRIFPTITLVDFRRPPGVFKCMITHSAFSSEAWSMAFLIKAAEAGLIDPSTVIEITF
jgi:hypothetical protein